MPTQGFLGTSSWSKSSFELKTFVGGESKVAETILMLLFFASHEVPVNLLPYLVDCYVRWGAVAGCIALK